MKIPLTIVVAILTIIAILLFAASNESGCMAIIAEFLGTRSKNLFTNSDFQNKFKGWNFNKGVSLIETNGIKLLRIENSGEGQNRIWQNINVITGKNYKLTYTLNSDEDGAFTIYRDTKSGKEKYQFCTEKNNNRRYSWTIKSNTTAKNTIYFSTSKSGVYYFSDISLNEINFPLSNAYRIISITILLLVILLLIKYNLAFGIVIILLALLPITNISKKTKSVQENRNLSPYKPLFVESKLNKNYGQDFNNWLNDHFFARQQIISCNSDIKHLINRKYDNNDAFESQDGWLFSKLDYKDDDFKNKAKFIKNSIDKLTKHYARKGIQIYFAIIPEKECLYSELHYIRKFDHERIPEELEKICTNNFIYFKQSLLNSKEQGILHFKEDHHWTHLGAFQGYKSIMQILGLTQLELKNFKHRSFEGVYNNSISGNAIKNSKTTGSTFRKLNLSDTKYKAKNTYDLYTSTNELKVILHDERHTIFKGGETPKRILLIGDSNIRFLQPFISSTFSDSCFIYAAGQTKLPDDWNINSYDNIINDFKPDYIFIIIRAVNTFNWMNLVY